MDIVIKNCWLHQRREHTHQRLKQTVRERKAARAHILLIVDTLLHVFHKDRLDAKGHITVVDKGVDFKIGLRQVFDRQKPNVSRIRRTESLIRTIS